MGKLVEYLSGFPSDTPIYNANDEPITNVFIQTRYLAHKVYFERDQIEVLPGLKLSLRSAYEAEIGKPKP